MKTFVKVLLSTVGLFVVFQASAAPPPPPTATGHQPPPPISTEHLRGATLTSLAVGTDPDGSWFWKATVKNTGKVVLGKTTMTVQGVEKETTGSSIEASGESLPEDLGVGKAVVVKSKWTRCYDAQKLDVQLRDEVANNRVLATKGVSVDGATGLCNFTATTPKWNASAKTWQLAITNNGPYSLSLLVGSSVKPKTGTEHWLGDFMTVVAPHSTSLQQAVAVADLQSGDSLDVVVKYDSRDAHQICKGGTCTIEKHLTIP